MKTLSSLTEIYNFDVKANRASLAEYKEAQRYYHGNQLSSEVLEKLASRGQAPIVENMYKMIVNKILGYKIQSLQEVKVSGRQEEDKPLADLLCDLLKAFSQQKEYDKHIIKRDRELIFGMAVIELWVQEVEGDITLSLKSIPTESFVIDAYSTDNNALDARRFHKVINVDSNEARALFDKQVLITQSSNTDPRSTLIESWFLENGSFNRYVWHESGGIYLYEETPFKEGIHPFVIAKYNIDEKNQWYGIFRDIKPMQDYINFAENRMVNMMGSLKAFFEDDAVLDVDEFIEAASLDNAIVKVRSGALKENKIHFVQHHADISALSQKAEQKRHLAKILSGLNDEALGMAINRQSGVAIAQRRDAGLMGLQDFIKAGDDMDRLVFEKVIVFMQHYYTKAQMFKITDKKTGERYFNINTNPHNTLRIGKFDLIYKSTLKMEGREERFAHWSEMLKTIASVRPDLVADLLPLMLRDTDSPIIADIEELIEKKAQEAQEALKASAPLEQQSQELELAKEQAKLQEALAKAKKYDAQGSLITAQIPTIQSAPTNNTAQGAGKYQIKGVDMR